MIKRNYEALLHEYLKMFPCVGIIGPRQCGKTTLLQTLPKAWKHIDLERTSDFQLVARDAELFLRLNSRQVAIDEAQFLPELFSALRVAIDEEREKPGRFVITGSSSPYLLRSISETLAGRIGVIEMAPLSWTEVYRQDSPVLAQMLIDRKASGADLVEALKFRGDLASSHDFWFRGGYPEPWTKDSERFQATWMDQYIRTYLYRDVGRLFPGLDQVRFQQFLQMLGSLSGTIVNISEVGRALGVSQPTARDYFEIAHGTFIWRRVPPYEKDATKRIVKHSKGYLRDSGLLHHVLRIPDLDALLSHPQMGNSWEGMVLEEILKQLNGIGAGYDYYFYRTAAGAEVDLVIEGDFGLIPIEIKYAQAIDSRQLRSLRNFVDERGCRLGVVINNDRTPQRYDEKVVGIPFSNI